MGRQHDERTVERATPSPLESSADPSRRMLLHPMVGSDSTAALSLFWASVDHFFLCDLKPPEYALQRLRRCQWLPLSEAADVAKSDARHFALDEHSVWSFNACIDAARAPRSHGQQVGETEHASRTVSISYLQCRFEHLLSELLKSRQRLSVFYYTRDGVGEGGSGIEVLKQPMISNVAQTLEDGGLIVSDGSNADRRFMARRSERVTSFSINEFRFSPLEQVTVDSKCFVWTVCASGSQHAGSDEEE